MNPITIILGFFMNPYNILFLAIGIGGGAYIGRKSEPQPSNTVRFLQPKTRSGYDLNVLEESARIIETERKTGFPYKRFLKLYDGYDIRKGNRVFTSYNAMEGSAFTTHPGLPEKDKIEEKEEKEERGRDEKGRFIPREKNPGEAEANPSQEAIPTQKKGAIISVPEFLIVKWGKETYDRLAKGLRDLIENPFVPVTVPIQEPTLPPNLKNITEDDFQKEIMKKIPTLIAEGVEQVGKQPLIEKVSWAGFGFAVCMALWVLGVFSM